MEEIIHYCWKHKIFPLSGLFTTTGEKVEVVSPGIHNFDAGPDFFNAKIKIGGTLWVGNVEIHQRTTDWYRHQHDKDHSYDNIILHVAETVDCDLPRPGAGKTDDYPYIPQVELKVPQYIKDNYSRLILNDVQPRCLNALPYIPKLSVHSWLTALYVERLEQRTLHIMKLWNDLNKDWEATLFVEMARYFGFGKNNDALEQWAKSIPMSAVGKHRDNLTQVEAIFFGMAGMLNGDLPDNKYFNTLKSEFNFLSHKFSLNPNNGIIWRFLRTRPQNFPTVRIAQLAMIFHKGDCNISKILSAESNGQIQKILDGNVSEYWQENYTWVDEYPSAKDKDAATDKTSAGKKRNLSASSVDSIIINVVVPMLFSYGKYKQNDAYTDKALQIAQEIKPETNNIINIWKEADVICENAADSQAILQLNKQYCEKHDCLRCRFGHEFIKRTPELLREDNNKNV